MDVYQERIRPLFDGSSETNAEIERKLGIPPKTINKWNTTSLKSWRNYIHQIASHFHVSTDYLLGNTDDPTPAGQKENFPQGGEPMYPEWYKELTPGEIEQVRNYAYFLISERRKNQP